MDPVDMAMNRGVQISEVLFSILVGICPEVKLLNHTLILFELLVFGVYCSGHPFIQTTADSTPLGCREYFHMLLGYVYCHI